MKKFVIKSLVYLLAFVLVANVLAFFALWSLGKSQFFKTTYLVNAFEPNQEFDYTVFGSSRSLASIDTKMISEKLGGLSVNFSMDYTALPSSKLMIQHFFDQGYTSKYVILSLDLPDLDSSKNVVSENDYRFLPFVKRQYVQEYFEKYDEGKVKPLLNSAVLPFLGIGYYNMELLGPAVMALAKPSYKYQFDQLGNYQYPDYLGMSEMPEPRNFESALSNPILAEIQNIVEKNGSKLLIYIAPYLRDTIKISPDCPYEVINHSRILNEPKLFSDYIHVVNSGKIIASEKLIEQLQSKRQSL